MSDKLRDKFEEFYKDKFLNTTTDMTEDFEIHGDELTRCKDGSYLYSHPRFVFDIYKAATERAARICDRKLTDCTHSYTASVLTRLAKEIRGE